jgi:ketosteroid isomerase-like protein
MRSWILGLSALVLAACQPQREPLIEGADVDAIRSQQAGLAAAINAGDLDASKEFYAIGHTIMEPRLREGEVFVGPELDNGSLIADADGAIHYAHINVEVTGESAFSEGACTITRTNADTGRPQLWTGHCTQIWRRGRDGVWRVTHENRNVAARPF